MLKSLSGIIIALLSWPSGLAAKDLASVSQAGMTFRVWTPTEGPLCYRMLSLRVAVNGADQEPSATLQFEATMPEHKHGMIVRPKVTEITEKSDLGGSERVYQIDGVKFHMMGLWEMALLVGAKASETRVPLPPLTCR